MEMIFTLTVIVCATWFAFYVDDVIDWLFSGRHSVKPELPKKVPNESTLERWHDAYDAAVLEGVDEAEAVKRADAALVPESVLNQANAMRAIVLGGYSKPVKHSLLDYRPLPGMPGSDLGSIRAKDGFVDLKWDGLVYRMTDQEWIRQGRPGPATVIKRALEDGRIQTADVHTWQGYQPVRRIQTSSNPLIWERETAKPKPPPPPAPWRDPGIKGC